ncbi:MAG: SDR family oxidoreductase [bacterium]|nr:SDR family oxidoreductase [bacterium]
MNPEKFNMIAPGILPEEHEVPITNFEREGRILITGGTEGIGRAIADEFLRRHNAVVICARNQEKLDSTKRDYVYGNSRLIAEKVDIGDRNMTKTFVQGAIEDLGGLDAVILNAATFDFKYKSSDLSEDEIRKEMFKVNEVGNVVVIREVRRELKETNGAIVFITTRFGVPQAKETVSVIDSESASAQEDIGNYIKNKKRIHEYLKDFIMDIKNEGIFVFSVIPGTVDTPANREMIAVGTPEISASKLKEREEGRERDSALVGRIIAKMTASRKKFNPEGQHYNLDIENGEVVEISNAVVEFEKNQTKRHILVGDVPYVGPDEGSLIARKWSHILEQMKL